MPDAPAMAISPADETIFCAPPHKPSRRLRVHTCPQASSNGNLSTVYVEAAPAPSAAADSFPPFNSDTATSRFSESYLDQISSPGLPDANAGITGATTLSASRDDLQEVLDAPVVHRKGRKDVYLCYKDPYNWFPHHDNVSPPHLPFLFKKAIATHQEEIPTKVRLMVCEGTQLESNADEGDVIIFPEMVLYKGLTVFDIESFVEDVLVHEKDWVSGKREKIQGTHVFVQPLSSMSEALNGATLMHNGLDGATLPELFKSEVVSRGLNDDHIVKASLLIHGHKHRGNVVVYRPDSTGLYTESCWSSLVCYESDVALFVDMFSGKAKTIEDVLKRHADKLSQDCLKDKQWLHRGFSFIKTPYALATLSVVVVIGTVIAFRWSKKAEK